MPAVLQVLTTFTSDPRELLEVRRSEAALKGKVAELTSKLKVRGESPIWGEGVGRGRLWDPFGSVAAAVLPAKQLQ